MQVMLEIDAYAVAVAKIEDYIKATYSEPKLQVSRAQIKQLSWVFNNPFKTNEMSVKAVEDGMHIEVKRALSRLYCLQLLREGGKAAYDKFVEAQNEALVRDKSSPTPLSFDSFQVLSNQIRALNEAQHRALISSTIMSSVTLSPAAKELAGKLVGKYPEDSVEFSASTVEKAMEMYPLVETLTEAEQFWVRAAFPHHTHFRHMMYTEGGQGMFETLRQKITNKAILPQEIDVWYCHWMINITGFRGHLNPKGSLYLTENTFQDMMLLKTQIDELQKRPKHDALTEYLKKRAGLLGFANTHDISSLVLAHIGAMLRLHTPAEGEELAKGFNALDEKVRKEITHQYFESLTKVELTPTYGPALFANVLAKTKDIGRTVQVCLPFYANAYANYRQLVATKQMASDVALNFNESASSSSVDKLLAMKKDEVAVMQIDVRTGSVKYSIQPAAQVVPISGNTPPAATLVATTPAVAAVAGATTTAPVPVSGDNTWTPLANLGRTGESKMQGQTESAGVDSPSIQSKTVVKK
jgi:hypothetical protein